MLTKLMILCGTVLLAVGFGTLMAMHVPVFDPGPAQVLVLGAMILVFAAGVSQLESEYQ